MFGTAFGDHNITAYEVQSIVDVRTTPDLTTVLPDGMTLIMTTDSSAPASMLQTQITSASLTYIFGNFGECRSEIFSFLALYIEEFNNSRNISLQVYGPKIQLRSANQSDYACDNFAIDRSLRSTRQRPLLLSRQITRLCILRVAYRFRSQRFHIGRVCLGLVAVVTFTDVDYPPHMDTKMRASRFHC